MLIQPTCLEPNFFRLILQFGRAYAKVGRRSHDSTLFLKLTGTWTHDRTSPHPWPHLHIFTYTYDHIYFELNKFFSYFIKISVTVNLFFRLLPSSALLLLTKQDGKRTSKVSSSLQKTALVAYGTKTSQNQSHGHFA